MYSFKDINVTEATVPGSVSEGAHTHGGLSPPVTRSVMAVAASPDFGAGDPWVGSNLSSRLDKLVLSLDDFPPPSPFAFACPTGTLQKLASNTRKDKEGTKLDPCTVSSSARFTYNVVQPAAPSPPEVPVYVELYTSFRSSSQPLTLLAALEAALSATHMQIDYQINRIKYKVKCLTYGNSGACHFKVSVYRSGEYLLVEFQRRRGCVVDFSCIYKNVMSQLDELHIVSPARPDISSISREIEPPVEESTQLEISHSCNLLMEMALAKEIDIQREATNGLFYLSSSQPNAAAHFTSSENIEAVLSCICTLLQSNEEDIVRNSSAFLYNLLSSNSPNFEQELSRRIPELCDTLCRSPLTFLNTDTKRYLSGSLSIVLKPGSPFRLSQTTWYALSQFSSCADECLRANVARVVAAVC